MNTATPSLAADLRLTPQARTVLAHLRRRPHITPMEALTVYGIPRLASCIHEIRNRAGYVVITENCKDDEGGRYGRYSLATRIEH
jgi:hypothetical protein